MEVEGQLTDFASEIEGAEGESSSEEELQDESVEFASQSSGRNNNAMMYEEDSSQEDTQMETASDGQTAGQKTNQQAELSDQMMEKMAEFMHKRGLIFAPAQSASEVQEGQPIATPSRQGVTPNRDGKATNRPKKGGHRDDMSEETIYQRAVMSKRDSSSSEEIMDISDETSPGQLINTSIIADDRGNQARGRSGSRTPRYIQDGEQPSTS